MPVAAVMAATAVVGAISSRNASKRSAAAQRRGQDIASQQVKTSTSEARSEIGNLFPQAIQAGQQGFQGAIDVLGQVLPQQAQLFQGGNVAAQQSLLAGLPQFQNAILGGQIDLSGLQSSQAQPIDFSFTQQQIPQVQSASQVAQTGNFFNVPNNTVPQQQTSNPLTGFGPSFIGNRLTT